MASFREKDMIDNLKRKLECQDCVSTNRRSLSFKTIG